MEGYGYIYGMINRSKALENAKKDLRHKRTKKKKNLINAKVVESKNEFDFPKLSEEELNDLKKNIQEEISKDRRKKIVLTILISILLLFICFKILR